MKHKRILTMQDISCVGQCSMTVALPILSACGHETCILPTALLSSHTGGFHDPYIRNLEGDIPGMIDHWKREGIDFDYIYTGYLGSIREIAYARQISAELLAPGGKLIVDPAMADHGKLYRGFDRDYVQAMKALCAQADIIIPNLTEAALLAGVPYRENHDADGILDLTARCQSPCVILTGVSTHPGETGVAVAQSGIITYHTHRRFDKQFHGTGDIFASAFVGALATGKPLQIAAQIAADYVCKCIEYTVNEPAHWYGVRFEAALPALIGMLNQ